MGAQGHGGMGTQGHRGVEKCDMTTRDMGTCGPESSAEQQQVAARAEDKESQKRCKKSSK